MDNDAAKKIVLEEFFREKIRTALTQQKINISEDVEFYLVHILTHFSRSDNLFNKGEDGHVEYRALALKFYDSVFAPTQGERFKHLKSLADTALYHAGVFYEGLYNKVVDVGYYINMGGGAYQSLANLSTGSHKSMANMFYELSVKFSVLVEILNMCCEKAEVRTDRDLLKLLDRYIKTGSLKAKEILEEEGLLPGSLLAAQTVQ
ncbi:MAG: hypothetical protein HQM16_19500 [Deltaproteobacteria bacterium]|nr:hypothetical protein [Deltaproteobacteria bacterium]